MSIDRVMKGLDRPFSPRHFAIQLRQVFDLDLNMKLAELSRAQTELSPREAMALNATFLAQAIGIVSYGISEFYVRAVRPRVTPDAREFHDSRPAFSSKKLRII